MRRLTFIMFIAILTTHYGYPLVASFYQDETAASKAWFYVLRGIEGSLLFLVVMALAHRRLSIIVLCAWGFVEEAQTAVCRLVLPMGSAPKPKPFTGLCDSTMHLPVYMTSLAVIFVVVLALAAREKTNG